MKIEDEIELAKVELENVDTVIDVKHNPVVNGAISVLKKIPFWGSLIDSSIETKLYEFQEQKQRKLLDLINDGNNLVTSDMVSDVEFLFNLMRTREAVSRLANNDKIVYFANLLRNGYLSGERIENDEFEEDMDIINTLSYRELCYLAFIWEYAATHSKKIVYNYWRDFVKKFKAEFPDSDAFTACKRLIRTAFINEVIETADIEEDSTNLDVEFIGYTIEPSFEQFYKNVLKKTSK